MAALSIVRKNSSNGSEARNFGAMRGGFGQCYLWPARSSKERMVNLEQIEAELNKKRQRLTAQRWVCCGRARIVDGGVSLKPD